MLKWSLCLLYIYQIASDMVCYLIIVRLVNGPTSYEGRVEVYHNGEWGTVCDVGWNLNDAQVVCSELGLGKAVNATRSAYYGQGSGPIWFDYLYCAGNEQTIGDCRHFGWENHYCNHGEDAGVKCAGGMCLFCIIFITHY